jgi:acyl-CoA synthetase (AMP-forming)/AMP-acid ligase II
VLLGDLLIRNVRKFPHKEAVIFEDTRYTFSQLNARVNSLANGLMGIGVKKGDRVAILANNCLQYMEIYLAVAKAGMVIVPLNYRLVSKELSYLLNNSEANTLIIGSEYLETINSIRSGLKCVEHFICLEDVPGDTRSYEELIAGSSPDEPSVDIDEEDMVAIIYTSGTTGLPKGAVATHKSWFGNATNTVIRLQVSSDDITLHVTPFFHVAPVWPMFAHFYMGATNVILRAFDPQVVLETMEKENITTCNMVPVMIMRLLECPNVDKYDLRRLRWIGYGASPMPLEVLKEAFRVFGKRFIQVYGLTEAGPLVTILSQEEHILSGPQKLVKRLESCGRPIINVEARVVNEKGDDVAPGEMGEIVVRGDTVMKGYWKNETETANVLKDGWLHTGDVATVDEDGYFYILDRKKDMIISGGENIYPREIEDVIHTHPAVRDVAVIGVPDEKWGEAVKAVIVCKEGASVSAEEIINLCKENLASYKKPKSVDFAEELPRNPTGKILKKVLREKYWKGHTKLV